TGSQQLCYLVWPTPPNHCSTPSTQNSITSRCIPHTMKLGKLHWPKWNRRQWIRNLLVGLVVFFLLYQLSFMARILWYQYFNPGASSFMRATIKELRAE